jgi:hypothetical protein
MYCDCCKIDRIVTDYLNNSNICYKCVYRKKLEQTLEKRTQKKPLLCRTCNKEILRLENQKKRQRNVFCSCECAEKGRIEKINNHWTKKICREFLEKRRRM